MALYSEYGNSTYIYYIYYIYAASMTRIVLSVHGLGIIKVQVEVSKTGMFTLMLLPRPTESEIDRAKAALLRSAVAACNFLDYFY